MNRDIPTKKCKKCGEQKPLTAFATDSDVCVACKRMGKLADKKRRQSE